MLALLSGLNVLPVGIILGQEGKTLPAFANGQAQVVAGFQDATRWIRQNLWVETEFDSDGNGKLDRVHVAVTRPGQTETEGLKVPSIYSSSPYFGGTADPLVGPVPNAGSYFWDVRHEVGEVPPRRTSAPMISFRDSPTKLGAPGPWVERGFAMVYSESPGTGLSQGCPTVGGMNESLAPKAVIDWLNGRARAFTTVDGNEPVVATWSTGKVGMIGTSYGGTLALAAATTGVNGLEAIIPVAPVTSFYHYYRSNGLVRSPGGFLGEDMDVLFDFINSGHPDRRAYCITKFRDGELTANLDRMTGDYNKFWASRDYLTKVGNIRAAVLMSHAFNDWNVVPEHSVRIYEALKKRNVPARIFFHQGEHGGDPPFEQENRWFTRFLYGINNGVEKEPRSWILREAWAKPTSQPTPYEDYPHPAAKPVTLHLQAGGHGTGVLDVVGRPQQGKETLTDNVSVNPRQLPRLEHGNHRLLYATPTLTEPVHLSGWSSLTTRLASSKPSANLSVWVIVLPLAPDTVKKFQVINRGWADPQNHGSLTRGESLTPGHFYTVTFNLQPDDEIIPSGSRIALMIFSSDYGFTLWPKPGTELTIDLDATSLVLPVVGGASALQRAFGQVKRQTP